MHKTKNTYLFEREYDKENSGVVDEALKRYWTNILGAEVISDLKNLYGIDIDSTLIGTNTYTTNQKNLDEIQELSNNFSQRIGVETRLLIMERTSFLEVFSLNL